MGADVSDARNFNSASKGMFSFRHFVLEFMLAQDDVLKKLSVEQEETLFMLALEQKNIKNGNPDIFSGLNELPTVLLYAKKAVCENSLEAGKLNTLLNFIQAPSYIDQNTINYLYNHFNSK